MAFQKTKKKAPRAKGEGSIYRRPDGMWVGTVELGYDENGKRKRKTVYSKRHEVLIEKLEELKADAKDGLSLDRTMTVAKWLDYWLPNVHKEKIRPTTYSGYVHTINNIKSALGKTKLIELQPADVRKMAVTLGKGTRRAQKAHVVLHRALNDAIAEGLIRRNVAAVVDAPDYVPKARPTFTVEEVHKILTTAFATRNHMEATRWMYAFLSGTRPGEALGAEWDRLKNLDTANGAVMDVSWQLQGLTKAHGCGAKVDESWPCGRKNGWRCPDWKWDFPVKFENRPLHDSLVLTRPKSNAGERWVPIIEPLREALVELKKIDKGPNPHGLVFHRADGSPVTTKDDNEAFRSLLKDAGIDEDRALVLYSARHTTATTLRTAGTDEQTRMEILGHNSPEVTRIYAHADQARNSMMMEALAVLVPKAEDKDAS